MISQIADRPLISDLGGTFLDANESPLPIPVKIEASAAKERWLETDVHPDTAFTNDTQSFFFNEKSPKRLFSF